MVHRSGEFDVTEVTRTLVLLYRIVVIRSIRIELRIIKEFRDVSF